MWILVSSLTACEPQESKNEGEDPVVEPEPSTTPPVEDCEEQPYFADLDGDGFGDPNAQQQACDPPAQHVEDDTDCDDTDPAVSPLGLEVCDERDNDCDTLVDGDDPTLDLSTQQTLYADTDGDEFGDLATAVVACPRDGLVPFAGDCDDTDPTITSCHPPLVGGELGPDRIDGVHEGQEVGQGVSGVGDFNGDGLDDLLIGGGPSDTDGVGWIVYGDRQPIGLTDVSSADVTFQGSTVKAVSAAGDMNGDGLEDVLLASDETVHLVYGGASDMALEDADGRWRGATYEYPTSLAGGSDVDGDGSPDFLVGVPYSVSYGVLAGRAFLVSGPGSGDHDLLSEHTAEFAYPGIFSLLGRDVLLPGDFDGDGLGEVMISDMHSAYVLYGPVSGSLNPLFSSDATLSGPEEEFSGTMAAAGDLDGDGLQDLLIGATGGEGAVYATTGAPWGEIDLTASHAHITGPADSLFGETMASADLDGDSEPDILVSAPGVSYLYLFFGPVSGELDTTSATIFYAETPGEGAYGDFIGRTLANVGDLDGDGVEDAAAGAITSPGGLYEAGTLFVLYGWR